MMAHILFTKDESGLNIMTNRNIAAIISIYWNDRNNFVKLAVESILNQTYKGFDYYIQYDGPVDAEVDAYLL